MIPGFGLSSFGCAQPTNFFRISLQWPVYFDAISSLDKMFVRISNDFTEDPHRTAGQIQLGKRLAEA